MIAGSLIFSEEPHSEQNRNMVAFIELKEDVGGGLEMETKVF